MPIYGYLIYILVSEILCGVEKSCRRSNGEQKNTIDFQFSGDDRLLFVVFCRSRCVFAAWESVLLVPTDCRAVKSNITLLNCRSSSPKSNQLLLYKIVIIQYIIDRPVQSIVHPTQSSAFPSLLDFLTSEGPSVGVPKSPFCILNIHKGSCWTMNGNGMEKGRY